MKNDNDNFFFFFGAMEHVCGLKFEPFISLFYYLLIIKKKKKAFQVITYIFKLMGKT